MTEERPRIEVQKTEQLTTTFECDREGLLVDSRAERFPIGHTHADVMEPQTIEALGVRAVPVQADVGDHASVGAAFSKARAAFGSQNGSRFATHATGPGNVETGAAIFERSSSKAASLSPQELLNGRTRANVQPQDPLLAFT
jgi:hypothetical protein